MRTYYVRYFQNTEQRLLLTGFSIQQPQYLHNVPYTLTFFIFLFQHGFTNKLNDSIHVFLADALQAIKARCTCFTLFTHFMCGIYYLC